MKFYNMGKIMDNVNIHNKYLLTTIVSERARQISADKSASRAKSGEEKSISLALADMEAGNVTVDLHKEPLPDLAGNEIAAEIGKETAPDAE